MFVAVPHFLHTLIGKWLTMPNTLTYNLTELITAIKSCIIKARGLQRFIIVKRFIAWSFPGANTNNWLSLEGRHLQVYDLIIFVRWFNADRSEHQSPAKIAAQSGSWLKPNKSQLSYFQWIFLDKLLYSSD